MIVGIGLEQSASILCSVSSGPYYLSELQSWFHHLLQYCYLFIQIPMGQPTSTQRDTSASASSSSSSALTPRGPDVQRSFAIKSSGLQVLLDEQELEPGHIIHSQIKTSSASATATVSATASVSASSSSSSYSQIKASSASASVSATASASSSSSSSASTPNGPYQVFINHRGPDVKKSFASFLYRELKSRGLQVFLDQQELEPGHIILSQLEEAIQSASVQIAIFSKTYAESKWCLDELVHMLETTRRDTISQRATILPVFYGVEPSELRRTDTGAYATAMRKHEKRNNLETIQKWKKALSDVAGISGFELEACNGDEVELVDMVVQRVLKEFPKPPPLFVANHKIGLQEKLEDFERTTLSRLEGQNRLEAKVVGIVGSGGIGKSTLAREFFNNKRSNYNFSSFSFLFDVRENARTMSLTHLQRELIKDIKGIDVEIKSWEEGIGILEKNLKSSHALIILDDVDHLHQLNALLPIKHVLDPMSLILITSRDKHVLRTARIADSSIYQLKGLDRTHSLDLFCWHAFFQPRPPPEFVGLVDGFLDACDGLPLSLQVFGALLCQQDISCWEEQLNGLQKLPHDIQKRLTISYDSLSQEEQQIFLDIACFSLGEDKDEWIKIWGWSGWKSSMGFRNLQNKCLVDVDEYNRIKMHDHLRDLGRSIAQDPSLPRRLWRGTPKDVYDLLEQSSLSVIEVRGIIMAPRLTWKKESFSDHWVEESISDKVFRISRLQLLEGWEDFVERILTKVRSPNLRWLRWFDCPCSSLPSCIPMRELRFLEVRGKRLERLESEPPLQLRELHISAPLLEFPNSLCHLPYLQKISLIRCTFKALPNAFGTLTNLQKISLWRCKSLEALPDSIENLRNLQNINLRGCTSLELLPNAIGALMNLQTIDLSGCVNLKRLPNFSEKLSNVHTISLRGCKRLEALPDSIENLRNLREIDMEGCISLEVLPKAIGALMNLQKINLSRCVNLKRLPNFSENLSNVNTISLRGCESLEALPDSIENLRNLQNINLRGCTSLEVLPNAIWALMNLQEIDLSGYVNLKRLPNFPENLSNVHSISLTGCKSLEALPDSIENLRNLRKIDLEGCISLEVLPNAIWALMNLQKIDLSGCVNLKRLPNFSENLSNVHAISLRGCESLEALPDSIENLRNLQNINLRGCTSLGVLPNAIGVLMNLQKIDLSGCVNLKRLPNFSENLSNVHTISLSNCISFEALPDSIENLRNLREIDLEGCISLEVLPNAIGALMNLQKIDLSGCVNLKRLPNFSKNLSNVNTISLRRCESLEALPDSIENLRNLQKINLRGCRSLEVLPNAIGALMNLQKIDVSGCVNLKRLPNFSENLSNVHTISLSNCISFEALPDSIENLLRLRHLHLGCCSRLILSNETLGNITTLKCLDLSGCLQIEVLPLRVLQQWSLKRLNLLSTNIRELPSAPTVCLNNLEVLILGSPLLKVLPPWLGSLENLKDLLLHGCRKLKCLPDSIGQCSQMRIMEISKCGIQYLPDSVMQLNNLEILRVRGCPLRELPFKKKVEGQGEPSVELTETSQGRELDSSSDRSMNGLREIHLYLTEISEVSFPAGVGPNLEELKIRWCNDLVEVGALPTTIKHLDLRGCGALRKVGGLCGLAQLDRLDIRGCCALEVEELPCLETVISMDTLRPILKSLKILKTPLETYDPDEEEEEQMTTAALDSGSLSALRLCEYIFQTNGVIFVK